MNLQLQSEHVLLLILTVVPAVLVLVFWLYPQTVASDAGRLRPLLRILRFLTITLLLFLLLHPLLGFHSTIINPPAVGLLLDNSSSMTVIDKGRARADIVSNLLENPSIKALRSRVRVMTGLFSDGLDTLTSQSMDTLSFRGTVTDFAHTFHDLEKVVSEKSIRSLILLSDGRMSAGENPLLTAQSLRIPIHTIIIGDSAQKPDLILDQVEVNPVAYVGRPIQLNLLIRSPGFKDQTATVTLRSDDQILDQEKIALTSDQAGHSLRLEFTPGQPGFQKVVLELSRFENELTYENNLREIYVQVRKRKIQIVLVAGRPSPDVGGIKRILTSDPDLDLKSFTLRENGTFYEGAFPSPQTLTGADVLLLMDVPNRGFPRPVFRSIQEALQSGVSLLWIAGPIIDHSQLQPISAFIPFSAMQFAEEQLISMRRTEKGRISPITSTFQNGGDASLWQRLPSIYSGWSRLEPREGAQVLAESDTGMPLITVYQAGQSKTVALTGSGWIRLDMLMKGIGSDNQVLYNILENSLRWLALRESIRPVQLEMEKRIFRAGEEIEVHALVFNEILQPVEGARVCGALESYQFQNPLTFEPLGEGRFRSMVRSFKPGENLITIQANYQDRTIGRDTVKVMIETFNPEFLNTRASPRLLRSIARATGGRFGSADSFESVINGIQYPPSSIEKNTEWKPLGSYWFLILLIFMLSIEWLIRKRSGML